MKHRSFLSFLLIAMISLQVLQLCERVLAEESRPSTPEILSIQEVLKSKTNDRCGPFALELCANLLNKPVSDSEIVRWVSIADKKKGATIPELAEGAKRLGLMTKFVHWADRPFVSERAPAILPVGTKAGPHFIVVTSVSNSGRIFVVDFPRGGWMDYNKFREIYSWNGYALHCTDNYWSMSWIWFLLCRQQIVFSIVVVVSAIVFFQRRSRKKQSVAVTNRACLNLPACLFVILIAGSVNGCNPSPARNVPAAIRMEPVELNLSAENENCTTENCTAKLLIVNQGSSPLRIEEISGSCQCTSIERPSNLVVAPEARVEIPIAVHLPDHGRTTARVNAVVVADEVRHRLSSLIILNGQPLPIPDMLDCPYEIPVRWVGQGEATALFYIRTMEKRGSDPWIQSVNLESLDSGSIVEQIKVEDSNSAEPDKVKRNYLYRVTLSPADAAHANSSGREHLEVVTLDSSQERSTIFLRMVKVDPVRAIPQSIYFNLDTPEPDRLIRKVTILFNDPAFLPTKIITQCDADWLKISPVDLIHGKKRTHGIVNIQAESEFNGDDLIKESNVVVKSTNENGETLEKTIKVTLRTRRREQVQTSNTSK
ncbi:MAG: hypothetical protein CME33_14655 [Gimesia sp.]|uniref:cysteine peptidase family C39 domain-containing protein n=1 Tax=Gimesia sp. TaxID=2024833 RepID=UPI000C38FC8A|nr:cysteine peptidase family C39 domain-containing protein [Gimesia sp.]MAX37795.1 hypothetical protein [Gimesia sp.]